jgi:hypothetical protein
MRILFLSLIAASLVLFACSDEETPVVTPDADGSSDVVEDVADFDGLADSGAEDVSDAETDGSSVDDVSDVEADSGDGSVEVPDTDGSSDGSGDADAE